MHTPSLFFIMSVDAASLLKVRSSYEFISFGPGALKLMATKMQPERVAYERHSVLYSPLFLSHCCNLYINLNRSVIYTID